MTDENDFEYVVVLDAAGNRVTFSPDHKIELNSESGRLYVSINGYDVAVYADRGWLMYGRPTPKPEAIEPADTPTYFEEEYDDEDGAV